MGVPPSLPSGDAGGPPIPLTGRWGPPLPSGGAHRPPPQGASMRGRWAPLPVTGRADLQQRQQQAVEAPPLQQAELRARPAQLAEQHQQRHLVGGDPVLDAEDVGVHHAVGHHGVEVEALVHAGHGRACSPLARHPGNRPPRSSQSRPTAAVTWR